MPYFLNSITPINQFTKIIKKYFVDKSELIEKMNYFRAETLVQINYDLPLYFLIISYTLLRASLAVTCTSGISLFVSLVLSGR